MRKENYFNAISRKTDYEVAKMLMDREDAMKPYVRPEIPKDMKYPEAVSTPTSLKAMFYGVLP